MGYQLKGLDIECSGINTTDAIRAYLRTNKIDWQEQGVGKSSDRHHQGLVQYLSIPCVRQEHEDALRELVRQYTPSGVMKFTSVVAD